MELNGIKNKQMLSRLAINNSGFIFDPMTGKSFFLNETGLIIFKTITDDIDVSQLKKKLFDEYDVGEQELEQDINDFFFEINKVFTSNS